MTSGSHQPHPKSFEPIEDFIARPTSVAEEKALYGTLYERLYQALKEGQLDFMVIAEKTGLKERRLREALLYRLTNEIIQLFGQVPGMCYVCQGSLYHPTTQEPLCLKCLQQADQAANEIPKRLVKEVSAVEESREDSLVMISKPDYERMLKELDYYRQKYPEAAHALDLPTSRHPLPVVPPDLAGNEADENDVLMILNMDNDDLPGIEDLDLAAHKAECSEAGHGDAVDLLLQSYSNPEPLRHFGFKRIKR